MLGQQCYIIAIRAHDKPTEECTVFRHSKQDDGTTPGSIRKEKDWSSIYEIPLPMTRGQSSHPQQQQPPPPPPYVCLGKQGWVGIILFSISLLFMSRFSTM